MNKIVPTSLLAWALWALMVFADVRVAILAEFLSLLAKVHTIFDLTKKNWFSFCIPPTYS